MRLSSSPLQFSLNHQPSSYIHSLNSLEKAVNRTQNRTLVMSVLSKINTMACFYAACAVCVTNLSTGGKFRLVSS